MALLTTSTHHSKLQVISAVAILHTSPITTPPAKTFSACCVFTSRSLATASNSGDSSASLVQVLSSQIPVQNSTLNRQPTTNCQAGGYFTPTFLYSFHRLSPDNCQLDYSTISSQLPLQSSTDWLSPFSPWCRPRRQRHASPIACVIVAAGTCLQSRLPATGLI
jgi:hypothetical protein